MPEVYQKYFVLKPRSTTPGDLYAKSSRKAMRVYANSIEELNPDLANHLREWASRESLIALKMEYPEEK